MAKRIVPLVFALFVVLAGAAIAQAAPTVTIIGTMPTDGTIGEGETLTLYWKIESTGSGTYRVEIGGDGTAESGTLVEADNGNGDYNGTTSGSTTITEDDLTDGSGDYTVYVIATEGEESAFANTTITLQVPPEAVTGLLVLRGDERLFVSWDESEAEDLDHYLLYYDTDSGSAPEDYLGWQSTAGNSPIDVGDVLEFELTGLENGVRYYIRVSAVNDSDEEGPLSDERSGVPTDTVSFSDLEGDEGECFIATAAFDDHHPMVRNLRGLRDQVLRHSAAGRWFIRTYYRLSPPAAGWIAHHAWARAAVRAALSPVAWAAGREVKHPGSVSVTLVLLLGAAWLVVRQRRANGEKE